MAKIAGIPQISSVNFYSTETNASTSLGAFAVDQVGRGYRYAQAGATDLVAGDLQQAGAEDTQFNELAVPAALTAGTTAIVVTNGTTTIAAGDFNDGILTVSVTPGIGQTFRILSHTTGASGAAITFNIEDPLTVALTTSSKVTVRKSPFRSVIIQPTTHTGPAVGIANTAVTAAKYCWVQSKGIGAALTDATVVAATTMGLSPSVTTAGCVTKHVNQDQYIGRSLVAVNVSAKVYPVYLQMD